MGTGPLSLSPKQEAFCQAYVRLGDPKAAYLEFSPHVKNSSAKREATRYLADPNILARIADLQEAIVERTKITVEDLITELVQDRKDAREAKKFNDAIKATENIAKLSGLWVDKSETTHTMRPDEARALVAQLAGKYLTAPPTLKSLPGGKR